jgi:hypothetical protein
VFNKRQSGRKDYIITSWGYKLIEDRATGEIIKSDEIAKDPQKYNDNSKYKLRYPGVKYDAANDRYIVEVMVPRPYFKNQEEIDLFERKLSEFLSTRIPTEDKRSMIVAKVVLTRMLSSSLRSYISCQVLTLTLTLSILIRLLPMKTSMVSRKYMVRQTLLKSSLWNTSRA